MRILIVSYYFPPLNSVACHRSYSWARYWSKAGHQVTVLTIRRRPTGAEYQPLPFDGFSVVALPVPDYYRAVRTLATGRGGPVPWTGRDDRGARGGRLANRMTRWLMHTGVPFIRFPSLIDNWIPAACRWAAGHGPWDLVASSYGPYANIIVAWLLRHRGIARRWLLDYRDQWTGGHAYFGLLPFSLVEQAVESSMVARADVVTTVSNALAKELQGHFSLSRVSVYENGHDPELFDTGPIGRSPWSDGLVRIVYTGSVYAGRQDAAPLLEAISQIAADPATRGLLDRFEVVFAGLDPGDVPALIRRFNVERWVRHLGLVGRPQAIAMQRHAHALLYLGWQDPTHDGIMTGKLYEYLFAGTEIWAVGVAPSSEPGRLLAESGAARFFGRDPGPLRHAVIELVRTGAKRPASLPCGMADRYHRRTIALRLLSDALGEGTDTSRITVMTEP